MAIILVQIILFLVQAAAFFAGVGQITGGGFIATAGLLLAVLAACVFLGVIGHVAAGIISYVGAHSAWHWEWWQAALISFPGTIFTIALLATRASAGMVAASKRRN